MRRVSNVANAATARVTDTVVTIPSGTTVSAPAHRKPGHEGAGHAPPLARAAGEVSEDHEPGRVQAERDGVLLRRRGRVFYTPLIGDGGCTPNLARFHFLDPASREFYPDWDLFAEMCVAIMRAEAGRDPHDRGLQNLVGELSTQSETFRTLTTPTWAS